MNRLEEIIRSEEWLKKIASDDSFWSDETIESWPSIIAYEYRLLRGLCKREKPYGVLFCLKDNFESFLKLEVLLSFAWVDRNCDEEFRRRTICQITSPNLTFGAWMNLAKLLLEEIEKNGYLLPEELQLKKVVSSYNKMDIVHWRNRKVAHGALELDEDESFRKEIAKKIDELARLYRTFDECLRNQQLYTNTAWLIGPDMARGLDTAGTIRCMLQKSGIWFSVDPYILICEVKENGVYFFDNQRTKTLSDFQMYAGGKGLRMQVPYFEKYRKIWSNGTLRLEAEPDDPYLTGAESRELDMLQMSRGFIEPKHLTNWLRGCVEHNGKGIFWLQMERGTGKSSFTEKINRLYKDALVIEEDLDVRTYHFSRSQSAGKYDIYSRIEWLWANDYDSSYSWQQTAGINDYERLDYTPAEAFSWFLDGVREYTEKSRGRKRILMVLDGLDEITENVVWEMLPDSEMLQDGVYLLLTSRNMGTETGLPKELQGIKDRLMVTERLAIERADEDNTVFLEEYVKNTNIEKKAKASMESLLEKSDYRVLYLGILCRLCEQGMDIRYVSDTGKIVEAYLNMLGQYYEEKEGSRIREVLAVLATLGEYEPLSLKDIAGLTAEGRLTLQLIGMIRDLTPMLKCERSPKGNLYKMANPGLAEELRKQLEEEDEIVSGLIDLGIDQIKGGYPPEIPAAGIVIAHLAELINGRLQFKKEVTEDFLNVFNIFSYKAGEETKTHNELQRACSFRKQQMWLSRAVLGKDHLNTIASMDALGFAYRRLGQNEEALRLHKGALEIRMRVLGKENPDTLNSMSNYGLALTDLGCHEEAAKILEQALEIEKRVLGEEHTYTLSSMIRLGINYNASERYKEAAKILEQALEIEKRVFGEEHPNTLACMSNLGVTYGGLERYEEAALILGEALEIKKRVLGEEHPDTLNSMTSLGSVYNNLHLYKEAISILEPTLEIEKRVLGEEHPNTLYCMNILGCTYRWNSSYEKALRIHEQALEIYKRVFGEEYLGTLSVMDNLGITYSSMGHYEDAERLHEQTLEIYKRKLGEEHPYTLASKRYLQEARSYVGGHTERIRLLEQQLMDKRRTVGEDQLELLEILIQLGDNYILDKQLKKAAGIYRNIIAIQEKTLGEEHSETISSIGILGDIVTKIGNDDEYNNKMKDAVIHYKEAVELLERKLVWQKRTNYLFDNNRDTAIDKMINKLGSIYGKIGLIEEKLGYIEETIDGKNKKWLSYLKDARFYYYSAVIAFDETIIKDYSLSYYDKTLDKAVALYLDILEYHASNPIEKTSSEELEEEKPYWLVNYTDLINAWKRGGSLPESVAQQEPAFNFLTLSSSNFIFKTREETTLFSKAINEDVKVRIGEAITECVGNGEKLTEFDQCSSAMEAADWLHINCPFYDAVVREKQDEIEWEIVQYRHHIPGLIKIVSAK